jgi:CelD/BcsL family acetyltransferase involved in cellulose biosynthesis
VSKKRYPHDVIRMPTCPICKYTCQTAYKIGSQQTILSLWQQGKLKDETGRSALFPAVEERKGQANAARTLSDVFKNSIGAAIKNKFMSSFAHLLPL